MAHLTTDSISGSVKYRPKFRHYLLSKKQGKGKAERQWDENTDQQGHYPPSSISRNRQR